MLFFIRRILRKIGSLVLEDLKNYKSQETQLMLKFFYRDLLNRKGCRHLMKSVSAVFRNSKRIASCCIYLH